METMEAKVCMVGAGPSGMSLLYQLEKLQQLAGGPAANLSVTCFEKQATWGGLWNFTWRTGMDEFGEPVHGSMYRSLWSNSPKESDEFPDYTFEQHFGKPVPSYLPREAMLSYLCGRWSQCSLKEKIKFLHSVHRVTFDADRNKFKVTVKDLQNDRLIEDLEFDYFVNCAGHFSTPNVPQFKGIDQFPGRVVHSHDLRGWHEFAGQRVLVVGSRSSAEDAVVQLVKHGAVSVVCSFRTKPMGYRWPQSVVERPALLEIDGRVARFQDGATAEVDSIILATGYRHHYPYLPDSLRLTGNNALYPGMLYKCTVWLGGGNNRMLYIGAQDQCYTFNMFDAQALWVIKYIGGIIRLPDCAAMEAEVQKWQDRQSTLKDEYGIIDFQTEFLTDLADESGYNSDLNTAQWYYECQAHKEENILTYRDRSFPSKFTGTKSPARDVPFMEAMDDSLKSFLAN